jgi:hypothetical protein
MQDEIWLPVIGYEGRYEVSNIGRVKSIIFEKHKILKPGYWGGYAKVGLSINGKKESFMVHVLVARMFIGPRPEGLFIDHLDNNPKNNRSDNLEYVTPRENVVRGKCCMLNENKYSKFYGVSYSKRDFKWCVSRRVTIKKGHQKDIHLGLFDSEIDANEVWLKFKDMSINDLIKHSDARKIEYEGSFSSKSKLVCFCNSKKRWRATKIFSFQGKKTTYQIGYFETEDKAITEANKFIDKNADEMMRLYIEKREAKLVKRNMKRNRKIS